MTIHLSHYPISCSPFIGPRIHITFVEEIIIPHGRTSPSHLLGAIGPTRLGRPAWRRSHGVVQPPSRAKTNLEFFYLFVKGWSNHPLGYLFGYFLKLRYHLWCKLKLISKTNRLKMCLTLNFITTAKSLIKFLFSPVVVTFISITAIITSTITTIRHVTIFLQFGDDWTNFMIGRLIWPSSIDLSGGWLVWLRD
jgi:hypothetical protein